MGKKAYIQAMKFRFLLPILVLFAGSNLRGQVAGGTAASPHKKILMVVTSTSLINSTGKATGTWLEEFAAPYYAFVDAGVEVTIASPKGGKGPVDPRSEKAGGDVVKRFNKDQAAQNRLNNTVKLSEIKVQDYDAVFYPGGHGPMWDLPEDSLSIHLIQTFYYAGKPVALVCHAPAALKNVKDKNGAPLVKGKQVTGYSNSEETIGRTTDAAPFLLEDMLKEKGAVYTKAKNWQPYTVADGPLITGQNPASAAPAAEKVLTALKAQAAGK